MNKTITRFAPSPTGNLHIGNSRTALINWLYTKKCDGTFILRFDDTDLERSKQEYKKSIEEDLRFLGITWDQTFSQSTRLDRYNDIKSLLLQKNRLYPCFETQEELDIKRKLQLSRGLPPIYDRAALSLTLEQINDYIEQGRKPHYRFLMSHSQIAWDDMIKGPVRYEGKNLADPIVIREDGSMTYILCSVIDDIDYAITNIIRGEDHVTNTAIQIQIFESVGAAIPNFGHLSLVVSRDDKISKRIGGFEISSLRDKIGLEPMAINSFFALLGTSMDVVPCKNLNQLIEKFDINLFSKSPTTYLPEELERLNNKLLINLSFDEIKDRLRYIGAEAVDEKFWLATRGNLQKLHEIKDWWNICYSPSKVSGLDKVFLQQSASLLPSGPINSESWNIWNKKIMDTTGKKGKDVYLPLRLAITSMSSGPEMSVILTLLSKEEIIKRLNSVA
jgi:glutamyl-tRNA synthetase